MVVCLCGGQSAPLVSGCSDPLLLAVVVRSSFEGSASLLLVVVVRLVVCVVRQVGVLGSVGCSLCRWLVRLLLLLLSRAPAVVVARVVALWAGALPVAVAVVPIPAVGFPVAASAVGRACLWEGGVA